jgi:hypothetical protein
MVLGTMVRVSYEAIKQEETVGITAVYRAQY